MKISKRKGISLIVLVITIIVIIILAGAVILSLSENNPISQAAKAVYLSDVRNFQAELDLYETKQFSDKLGAYYPTLLQADDVSVTYNEEIDTQKTINDLIPTLGKTLKYAGQFQVVDGNLVFQGSDIKKQNWAREAGLEVVILGEPIVTIIPPVQTMVASGVDIVYTARFSSNAPLTTIDLINKVEVVDDSGVALPIQPVIVIGTLSGTDADAIRQVDITIKTDSLTNAGYKLKIKAGAVVNANNVSSTKDTISLIGFDLLDETPPTNPVMSANPTSWTTGNVTVTINYSEDSAVKEYSLDGINWSSYTAEILVTENNTTIYARARDNAGNESGQSTITISNIVLVSGDALQQNIPEGWIPITTVEDLAKINSNLSANYILMQNLDLNIAPYNTGYGWTTIGNNTNKFTGQFDGNGLTINNLYINKASQNQSGLFGFVTKTSIIKNITLQNVNVTGGGSTGSIVGYNEGGLIQNLNVTGNVKGSSTVGGVAGYSKGVIKDSVVSVNVSGQGYLGGVVGQMYLDTTYSSGRIENIIINNDVTATGSTVGGAVGYCSGTGTGTFYIGNVSNKGNVTGTYQVGGLLGATSYAGYNTIRNSNSIGNVTGGSDQNSIGGLIGSMSSGYYGAVEDSYATGNVYGGEYVGGLIGYFGNSKQTRVSRSYSTGNVEGTLSSGNVGGLIGYVYDSANDSASQYYKTTINQSYASGNVYAPNSNYVGGLIGQQADGTANYVTVINDTFALGTITGKDKVGGLIGSSYNLAVTNSYSIGKVIGTTNVGGMVGSMSASTSTNSYWSVPTSEQTTSIIGTPNNIQNMLYTTGYTGWNFTNTWSIDEGSSTAYITGLPKPEKLSGSMMTYSNFSSGRGTSANPYIIQTETQLNNIRNELYAYYKLANDITMTSYQTGEGWLPVGDGTANFTGGLDGDNHKISNLYINRGVSYVGLFGYVNNPVGEIKNLNLENIDISGGYYTGGLIGYNLGNTVKNITASGNVISTNQYIGGILGYNGNANIDKITSNVNVTGNGIIGGLIGYTETRDVNSYMNITNVKSTGTITGTGNSIGGLIGVTYNYGNNLNNTKIITIDKASSTGNVVGNTSTSQYVGGLIGYQSASVTTYKSYVTNSYSTGNVTGYQYVGGLVGKTNYNQINSCYAVGQINGAGTLGGLVASQTSSAATYSYFNTDIKSTSALGTGKTTAEMKIQSTFQGWNFTTIWSIQEGINYPTLR